MVLPPRGWPKDRRPPTTTAQLRPNLLPLCHDGPVAVKPNIRSNSNLASFGKTVTNLAVAQLSRIWPPSSIYPYRSPSS